MLVLILVLPLIYTALLEYTGYYFTTPFFLAGYLFLTGERRIKLLVAVPAITYVLLTVVFRSEEHTSELQSLMRISYAVFCLKKKTKMKCHKQNTIYITIL